MSPISHEPIPNVGHNLDPQFTFVFGAQGTDFTDQLCNLIKLSQESKIDALHLCTFLQSSYDAILEEATALPSDLMPHFPAWKDLKTLMEMVRHHRHTKLVNASLNGTLLFITQIATILAQPLLCRNNNRPSNVSEILSNVKASTGFCSGFLAATAVATSSTPLELITNGVELVRLAFWIGARSSEIGRQINDASRGTLAEDESWCLLCQSSTSILDVLQDAVTAFNKERNLEDLTSLVVGGVTSQNVATISGAPHLLKTFKAVITAKEKPAYLVSLNSSTGSSTPVISCNFLPVCSPYHSVAALKKAAVKVLSDVESRNIATGLRSQPEMLYSKLILPTTGEPVFKDAHLLRTAVECVLTQANRWDFVTASSNINKWLTESDVSEGRNCFLFFDRGAKALCTLLSKAVGNILGSSTLPVLDGYGTPQQSGKGESERKTSTPTLETEKIAIVSMSCRFPNGVSDPEQFWKLLEDKIDCHREIPTKLFDWKQYQPCTDDEKPRRNTLTIPWGNFLDNPDLFDNRLFNMSPREALQLDPQHRLALMCCYEAMEDAGYVPDVVPTNRTTRMGCFIGASSDDYRENASSNIGSYFITGNIRAFIPGHVSFTWNWEGPSNSIDTACSSSLVAIEAACDALLAKQCDSALAGGVTVMTQPQMFIGEEKAGMLSPSGQSATFGENVDGICRGDGIGIVMLKRYSDAVAERDNILGLILETKSNFRSLDPETKFGVTDQSSLERLYTEACQRSGVDPQNIAYVDVHGLGNKADEAAEVNAIASVFGSPQRSKPLYLGSPKPCIGYSEAASGMAGLFKSLLSINKKKIVGLRTGDHFKPNKGFQDLEKRKVQIPTESIDLTLAATGETNGKRQPLVAAVSNINFLGGNSVLLLQEGIGPAARKGSDPRTSHIVIISAKTAAAAAATRDRWIQSIALDEDNTTLSDLSYTSTARRMQFGYRIAAHGKNWDEIRQKLANASVVDCSESEVPLIALDFSNHDSSPIELVRDLYKSHLTLKRLVDELSFTAQSAGCTPVPILPKKEEEDEDDRASQEALAMVCQIALALLYRSWGVVPEMVTGQGLGRLAALVYSGVIRASEAFLLASIIYGSAKEDDKDITSTIERLAKVISFKQSKVKLTLPSLDHVIQEGETLESNKVTRLLRTLFASQDRHSNSRGVLLEQALVTLQSKQQRKMVSLQIGKSKAGQEAPSPSQVEVIAISPETSYGWGDISRVLTSLFELNLNIDWVAYHQPYIQSLRLVKLPNYAFDLISYWMEYQDRGLLPTEEELELNETEEEEEEEEDGEENGNDKDKGSLTGFPLLGRLVSTPSFDQVPTTSYLIDMHSSICKPLVKGHLVHEVGIIPASLYGEQAMEAAIHHLSQFQEAVSKPVLQVTNMNIPHPFILDESLDEQLLTLTIQGPAPQGPFTCTWTSTDPRTSKVTEHGNSQVEVVDEATMVQEWKPLERVILQRKEDVKKSCSLFPRILAYRLFTKVVDYTAMYQGMLSVGLLAETKEAVTVVRQSSEAIDAPFVINPVLIDSLGQITGFLPNVGLAGSQDVFIANGCGKIAFAPAFCDAVMLARQQKQQPTFEVYAHGHDLQGGGGGEVSTNCYFIYNDRIVGMMSSVRFKRIKLSLMQRLLPKPSKKQQPIRGKEPNVFKSSEAHANATGSQPRSSIQTAAVATAANKASLPTGFKSDTGLKVPQTTRNEPIESLPVAPASGFAKELMQKLRHVLIEELGVDSSDLTQDKQLADLGLDSLMSLQILGSLRDSMEVELPGSFFFDYTTLGKVDSYILENFGGGILSDQTAECPPTTATNETTLPAVETQDLDLGVQDPEETRKVLANTKPTKPILISGRKHIGSARPIFLLPDGSGTAAVYADFPDCGRPVYAINSPFLVSGEKCLWSVDQIAAKYLESIRTIQAGGSYLVAGWSFGGIVAVETARLLLQQGNQVEGVVLIDSPDPAWPPLPSSILDWVYSDDNPEMKSTAPPSFSPKMKLHFATTLAALKRYQPKPLSNCKALVVNGVDGLGGDASSVKEFNVTVGWLQKSRRNVGMHGWETILDSDRSKVVDVGGNHFTICKPPHVGELTDAIVDYFQSVKG